MSNIKTKLATLDTLHSCKWSDLRLTYVFVYFLVQLNTSFILIYGWKCCKLGFYRSLIVSKHLLVFSQQRVCSCLLRYLRSTRTNKQKIGKWAESHDFRPQVIHQRIKSPTCTVPVNHLVKQHAEITVLRKTKFCYHNVKPEPDKIQLSPPSPLTGSFKDYCRTSEDKNKTKITRIQAHIHQRSLPVRKAILVKYAQTTIWSILITRRAEE